VCHIFIVVLVETPFIEKYESFFPVSYFVRIDSKAFNSYIYIQTCVS